MCQVQKQAIQRWREDLKAKYSGQSVSSKEWWCGVKQQQGLFADHSAAHQTKRLAPPLTIIFNNILSSCKWPTQWKEARVVAIHKKNSKWDPKNYRPISILITVGKILESLITTKINTFLDAHHLLNSKQFGFRQGRSAADLLLLQSASWNHSLDRGMDTFVVALDIAGALTGCGTEVSLPS
ncbi:putative RNA-directed DNA polymerase from transposon X-element [Chionoecetes opilio]|uniref:Putative RNA-directed DNA polymerase from transposon X-element n=1 Tax=Chionoecetes opilio TaxID=41210 RepID=A0A8J4YZH1_CHIOP|nr:putative RNA-directed DNA polymerase from transposon X-element [Chionoecetes opilio]